MTLLDDFMEHAGVKGMKWGIRKDRRGSGEGGSSSAGKGGAKGSEGEGASSGKGSSSSSSGKLSDAELRKKVQRLQMEQQYRDLMAKEAERNRSAVQKGADFLTKVMVESGKQIATGMVKAKMTEMLAPRPSPRSSP